MYRYATAVQLVLQRVDMGYCDDNQTTSATHHLSYPLAVLHSRVAIHKYPQLLMHQLFADDVARKLRPIAQL